MEVEVLNAAESPEQDVCTAARNDYMEGWVGEETFGSAMTGIEATDHDEIPEEVWNNKPAVTNDTTARMWTLLTHLMDHGHFGPFEHPHITIAVKGISRSLMAQITRHRPGITFDIQSMRYVDFDDVDPAPGEGVVMIPELDDPGICGRHAEFDETYEDWDGDEILESRRREYEAAIERAYKSYNHLLEMGTAPENARMVLPIGTKVNMVVTLNARTLMHVADMRAAADAQWEVRAMTDPDQVTDDWDLDGAVPDQGILDVAQDWMPMTFTYYKNEMMNRKNRLAP